jgi:hypothetical protein
VCLQCVYAVSILVIGTGRDDVRFSMCQSVMLGHG